MSDKDWNKADKETIDRLLRSPSADETIIILRYSSTTGIFLVDSIAPPEAQPHIFSLLQQAVVELSKREKNSGEFVEENKEPKLSN